MAVELTTRETEILSKTKELCETIVAQPQFRTLLDAVEGFMNDPAARTLYEQVSDLQQQLSSKQDALRHTIRKATITLPVTIPLFFIILIGAATFVHLAFQTALHNAAVELIYSFFLFGCFGLAAASGQYTHNWLIERELEHYRELLRPIARVE